MSRTLALISDIHANLEALQAVLERIDQLGIKEIMCLGDVVGYGVDPEACIDLVRSRCDVVLCGNHDDAILNGAPDFNPIARDSIDWTRDVLKPGLFRAPSKRKRWAFISGLKQKHVWGDLLFVHASPRDPIREYVLRTDVFLAPGKLREIFAEVRKVCFIGHTHQPGVFVEDEGHFTPAELHDRFVVADRRVMINVGSVGQPRDGDPRASFAILTVKDNGRHEIRFERISYDLMNTMRKIAGNPRINDLCASRLKIGR